MDISLEKQKIKQQIDSINDESLIQSIKRFLGLVRTEKHLPLTKEELISRALESERAINEKRFISIDELEKEMKNW